MKSILILLLLGCVAVVAAWDECPTTCYRQRSYTVRCGLFGWSRCRRTKTESYSCTKNCWHGGWSNFTVKSESACSATCGGGTKNVKYQRTCTNPAPSNGGRNCVGNSQKTESKRCNTQHCPIDGQWTAFTEWQDYDECSVLCGQGVKDQWRSRTCTNPAPAFGGKNCQGVDKENQTVNCNTEPCGDKCPEDATTYIAHPETPNRYYHCDNGVARLSQCQDKTRWVQNSHTCDHAEDQQAVALNSGNECDPSVPISYSTTDCTRFVMCVHGTAHAIPCPAGTLFNGNYCDFAANVVCPFP